MKTDVLTPQQIFTLPQHFVVPLFQRPYVWDEADQWLPLWQDIERMANLRLADPFTAARHFLGAIVLQAQDQTDSRLPARSVIDGQQRLTTLQLLADAAAAVLEEHAQDALAAQLEALTHNAEMYLEKPADALKLRHTNDDGVAFHEVMNAEVPIAHGMLVHSKERIVGAHAFFVQQVSEWMGSPDDPDAPRRAQALAGVIQQGIQLVVIDLLANENSQEIFETLNARGTPLTAADLIKNFVFQRLDTEGADTATAYKEDWPFEKKFWDKEIGVGRYYVSRGSLFLNQWLGARVGEEVSPKQTFTRFKHYVEHEADQKMLDLLRVIKKQADDYESWTLSANEPDRTLKPVERCVYRMAATGVEVLKPILLWLHDPALGLPQSTIDRVVGVTESWLIRRQLVRLPSGQMGRIVADVIRIHRGIAPEELAERIENYLTGLTVSSNVWPGDEELRQALRTEDVYRKFPRGRLRMVLEAIEDHLRAPHNAACVPRRDYPIEHLIPQKWETNWPVEGLQAELDRAAHVHRLGNLTLLTESLNSSVSNGRWLGSNGKREKLGKFDVLLMNREIRESSTDGWDEGKVDQRTEAMVEMLAAIWPVPPGHQGVATDVGRRDDQTVEVKHLVARGLLPAGTVLSARPGSWGSVTAVVGGDGSLEVAGTSYPSPSAAGTAVRKGATNGWSFWRLSDGRRLADVRAIYLGEQPRMSATAADLTSWEDQPDVDLASEFWSAISEPARTLFRVVMASAPEPVSIPAVAEALGVDRRSVAGMLAWPGRIAGRLGYQLPTQFEEGEPPIWRMSESVARLFSQVDAQAELGALTRG